MPEASRSCCASRRVDGGSIEDMSISSRSALAPSATPPGPNTAASTMAAELRLVMTYSLANTASAALAAPWAPSATSAATFSASRSYTDTRWPASSRRRLMAEPMIPVPMTATAGNGNEVAALKVMAPLTGWP